MQKLNFVLFLVLGWLADSVSCQNLHHTTSTSIRIAIARPFSETDAHLLPQSFEIWETHPPCRRKNGRKGHKNDKRDDVGIDVTTDLLLVFSQTLEYSPEAQDVISQVQRRFDQTNGWGNCIRHVKGIGVGIEPDEDVYDSIQQDTNPLWVNGPNRHFERTVRYLQASGGHHSNTKADLMYLMEMDSVPVRDYWLDAIVDEIKVQANGFAILGSKYRGDKWNSFYSELPAALVNHINGNAVYNLTHPLFDKLVDQLESERATVANAIPFDYRISQLMEEIQTGKKPVFPTFPDIDGTSTPSPRSEIFQQWATTVDFDLEEAILDVGAIGNYAKTNMIPEFLDEDAYIVHGAKMLDSWKESDLGTIALVISDWADVNSQILLSHLDKSDHPFSEVVVMLPTTTPIPSLYPSAMRTPVRFVNREKDSYDYMDLCTAPVQSDWFLLTDSYHRVRPKLHVLTKRQEIQSDRRNPNRHRRYKYKPVISYIKATRESCFDYSSCTRDLELARQISPSIEDVFQNQDVVYQTQQRQRYCEFWSQSQSISSSWTSLPFPPPSAMSYMAYLKRENLIDPIYTFSDRADLGSRPPFIPLTDDLLPKDMLDHRRHSSLGVTTTTRKKGARISARGASSSSSSDGGGSLKGKGSGSSKSSIKGGSSSSSDDGGPSTSKSAKGKGGSSSSSSDDGGPSMGNQTDCTILVVQWDCMNKEDCQWQPNFESCHDRNGNRSDVVDDNSENGVAGSLGGGRPREYRPVWVTVLIALGLASGTVALLTLVGVGSRRVWQTAVVGTTATATNAPAAAGVIEERDNIHSGGGSITTTTSPNQGRTQPLVEVGDDIMWLDRANDELRHTHKPWLPAPTLEELAVMMDGGGGGGDGDHDDHASHNSSNSNQTTLGAVSVDSMLRDGPFEDWNTTSLDGAGIQVASAASSPFDPLDEMVEINLQDDINLVMMVDDNGDDEDGDVNHNITTNTTNTYHISSASNTTMSSDSPPSSPSSSIVGSSNDTSIGSNGGDLYGTVVASSLLLNGHFEEQNNKSVEYVRDPINDTVTL